MADTKKIADLQPPPWTSAHGPWALIRRAVGIPARNPAAAAAEEAALAEMRAEVEREFQAEPSGDGPPVDEIARRMRATSRPGDLVLDPFTGAATTGLVAVQEGRRFVGCELSADYCDIAKRRLVRVLEGEVEALSGKQPNDLGPLFSPGGQCP